MGGVPNESFWLSLIFAFSLVGCASLPRDPVPPAYADKVAVLDGSQVRYWGDRAPSNINALAAEKWAQVKATRPYLLKQGARPQISFLAVSGVVRTGRSARAFWLDGPREATAQSSTS
jgi:hypothetical protein